MPNTHRESNEHPTQSHEARPALPGRSIEHEVLLLCARTRFDDAVRNRLITMVGQPLDWNRLIDLAEIHGIVPLLARSLDDVKDAGVPDSTIDKLRATVRKTVPHSYLLLRELQEVNVSLQKIGIRVLAFKGPDLSINAYGSLAYRAFNDLDLLVQKENVYRALEVLTASGYEMEHGVVLSAIPAMLTDSTAYNVALYHSSTRLGIELHWKFSPLQLPFPMDYDKLWTRTREAALGQVKIEALSAEDHLLALCIHGARHGWSQFRYVCDINELVLANPNLDWEAVYRRACDTHVRRMLLLSLILARNLLALDLAEPLASYARDPQANRLAEQIHRRLCTRPKDWDFILSRDFLPLQYQMLDHPLERLRFRLVWLRIFTVGSPSFHMDQGGRPLKYVLSLPWRALSVIAKRLKGRGGSPAATS